jgi:NADPH:quinone reductase-like Zn-dependent oxidoreductase
MVADLADRIANLPPDKRALLLRALARPRKDAAEAAPAPIDTDPAALGENFCYALGTPGNFAGLRMQPLERSPPGPGEIQFKARAASLNFRDLMIAMALYPETPGVPSLMGSDYAGDVLAVGEGVDAFSPGDQVMALSAGHLGPSGHFCAVHNISALQAVRKPEVLDFVEAASVPTVFLTSYYALHRVAQLKAGERVLIHSATGGVGLAAIQVARWLGAEIFATAGSESKRDFLRSLGIESPMDSRSDKYAEKVLELTGGKGVDVVLNTLAGPAGMKGIEILGNFGRFIQIDKQDIFRDSALKLGRFNRGLTFSAVDLSLFVANPARLNELFLELADQLQRRSFKPVPVTAYPVSRLADALSLMSHYKHIGKLVLDYAPSASRP